MGEKKAGESGDAFFAPPGFVRLHSHYLLARTLPRGLFYLRAITARILLYFFALKSHPKVSIDSFRRHPWFSGLCT